MVPYLLIVDDDLDLCKSLTTLLRERDISVKVANKGSEALDILQKFKPDLILLDLVLPDIDGQSLCVQIKRKLPEVPIIMLTAKDSTDDKVKGFEGGADDYLTKPFEIEELFARIKARLKNKDGEEILQLADLTLNPKTVQVFRGNKEIILTPQEFRLLEYLMSNKGIVLTRDMILNRIWLYSPEIDTRVVDVYVGYLRKKIDNGNEKKLIHSIRGFGYILKD